MGAKASSPEHFAPVIPISGGADGIPEPEIEVKSQVIVTVGAGGKLATPSAPILWDKVESILLVVDPRQLENIIMASQNGLSKELQDHNAQVKIFLLLPSTSSSPEAMLNGECQDTLR